MRTEFSSRRTRQTGTNTVDRPWLRVKFGICIELNIRSRVRCSIMCSIMCSLFAHFEFSVRVRSCSIIYDFPSPCTFVFNNFWKIRIHVGSWSLLENPISALRLKRLCGNYFHAKIMSTCSVFFILENFRGTSKTVSLKFFTFKKLDLQITARRFLT